MLGRRVDVEHDPIEVDGVLDRCAAGPRLLPAQQAGRRGHHRVDPAGTADVVDLVPDEPACFPVGRLDADTEGLLLLTNDGDLTHRLTHPSFGVEKEYLAEVEGTPTPAAVRRLREGVELDDGLTAPAKVVSVSPTVLRITIHEGRNRQVRRMCEAVGHPVVRLVRTRIGPLADRRLEPGQWRPLTQDEVRGLEAARPSPRSE